MVERCLAKANVASSNLVFRSIFFKWCHRQVVRPRSAKPLFPSSNLGGTSKCRDGGIGRRKGLKIPRGKLRTGSSPVPGTSLMWLKTFIYKAFSLFYVDIFLLPFLEQMFKNVSRNVKKLIQKLIQKMI